MIPALEEFRSVLQGIDEFVQKFITEKKTFKGFFDKLKRMKTTKKDSEAFEDHHRRLTHAAESMALVCQFENQKHVMNVERRQNAVAIDAAANFESLLKLMEDSAENQVIILFSPL